MYVDYVLLESEMDKQIKINNKKNLLQELNTHQFSGCYLIPSI